MRIREQARTFQRTRVSREISETWVEERQSLIIFERGVRNVERARHHAHTGQTVVDHLTEHVGVEHVALTKQRKAPSQR